MAHGFLAIYSICFPYVGYPLYGNIVPWKIPINQLSFFSPSHTYDIPKNQSTQQKIVQPLIFQWNLGSFRLSYSQQNQSIAWCFTPRRGHVLIGACAFGHGNLYGVPAWFEGNHSFLLLDHGNIIENIHGNGAILDHPKHWGVIMVINGLSVKISMVNNGD